MDAEIILTKARFNCAYCASYELFHDLEKLRPLPFQQVLKLFAIWNDWYVRRRLAVLLNDEKTSQNEEELLKKQAVRHEYQFLRFDFLNKFCFYVPAESVVMAYIEELQADPLHHVEEIIAMQDFLRYMYVRYIFNSETDQRLTAALDKAVNDLQKL